MPRKSLADSFGRSLSDWYLLCLYDQPRLKMKRKEVFLMDTRMQDDMMNREQRLSALVIKQSSFVNLSTLSILTTVKDIRGRMEKSRIKVVEKF